MIHHDLQNKNEIYRATFDVGSNGLTVYQHFENGLFQRIVFDLSRTQKKNSLHLRTIWRRGVQVCASWRRQMSSCTLYKLLSQ